MEKMNKEEQQKSQIYDQIVLAVKSSEMCAKQRKAFAMCRATLVGRSGDPAFCESQAASFIKCHNDA